MLKWNKLLETDRYIIIYPRLRLGRARARTIVQLETFRGHKSLMLSRPDILPFLERAWLRQTR